MWITLNISIAHHDIHVERQVLHRDLSHNNVMWTRDEANNVIGVLNDWDLAAYPHTDANPPEVSTKDRTGTLPFMARDLLRKDPAKHLYSHDLESFFYILMWCCINYRLGGLLPHTNVDKVLEQWRKTAANDGDFSPLRVIKMALFINWAGWDALMNSVKPDFRPLVETLNDLYEFFQSSQVEAVKQEGLRRRRKPSTLGIAEMESMVQQQASLEQFPSGKGPEQTTTLAGEIDPDGESDMFAPTGQTFDNFMGILHKHHWY